MRPESRTSFAAPRRGALANERAAGGESLAAADQQQQIARSLLLLRGEGELEPAGMDPWSKEAYREEEVATESQSELGSLDAGFAAWGV